MVEEYFKQPIILNMNTSFAFRLAEQYFKQANENKVNKPFIHVHCALIEKYPKQANDNKESKPCVSIG